MAGRQKSFAWKSDTLFKALKNFDERANTAVGAAFEFQATRSEARMKTGARWTDDTGNARNGLFTAVQHEGTRHALLLSHGVDYGLWLELAHAGRYAIVLPTFIVATEELRVLLGKLFSNMKGGA